MNAFLTREHFERERSFQRSWLPLIYTEDVPEKGSYFVHNLPTLNTSLLIVRGNDDKIRTFTMSAGIAVTSSSAKAAAARERCVAISTAGPSISTAP